MKTVIMNGKKLYRLKCQKCGREFLSENAHPPQCPNPRCRSSTWDKPGPPVRGRPKKEKSEGSGK